MVQTKPNPHQRLLTYSNDISLPKQRHGVPHAQGIGKTAPITWHRHAIRLGLSETAICMGTDWHVETRLVVFLRCRLLSAILRKHRGPCHLAKSRSNYGSTVSRNVITGINDLSRSTSKKQAKRQL